MLLSGGGNDAQSTCGGDDAQSTCGGDDAQSTCGGDDAQSTCGGDDAQSTGGGDDAQSTGGGDNAQLSGGETNAQSTCSEDNGAFSLFVFIVAGDKGTAPTLRHADQHKSKEGTYADGSTPAGGDKLGCSVHWFEQHPTFEDGGHCGAVGVRAWHLLPRRRRGRRGQAAAPTSTPAAAPPAGRRTARRCTSWTTCAASRC